MLRDIDPKFVCGNQHQLKKGFSMRRTSDVMDLRNAFTAVVVGSEGASCTSWGATVDTNGFADVLAVITAGATYGTSGAAFDILVQFQESITANGSFTDITDGQVNGSFQTTIHCLASTAPFVYMAKVYERLQDGTRMRYIRPRISVIGTAASRHGATLSIACLLGRPQNTLYVANAASASSGNSLFGLGSPSASYKV
jgi:hypothetical protein